MADPIQVSLIRVAPSNGDNCVVTVNTTDGQILTVPLQASPSLEQVIDALTSLLPS